MIRNFSVWLLIFSIVLISCERRKAVDTTREVMASREMLGSISNDSMAAPDITLLTARNAPKVIPAGKPLEITNPHADGLGDPDFTHFGTADGLALENTTRALMDRMGNLWFASWGGGVSRYDGKKFTIYSSANGFDNGIISMAQDMSGNLWFNVGADEVYRYDGMRFEDYGQIAGLVGATVTCIYGDTGGNVWFGTRNGVIKYLQSEDGRPAKKIIYTTAEGLISNRINCISEDKLGNLWFGAYGAGVTRFDGKHIINYTEKDGLINNHISCMEVDASGNMWFGTDSGASVFDGRRFTNFTMKQGLVNNEVHVITGDKEGVVWLGTDGGISKFEQQETGKPAVFINYTKSNGLSDNNIQNITEDRQRNMWIGTNRGGICRYNRNHLSYFTTLLGLAGNNVKSIIQDNAKNLWFGTEGGGVSKYDGHTFYNYTSAQGLPNNEVYSMLQDRAGNIWFGCYGAVSKYDGRNFTNYSTAQGIPNAEVWNMLEDDAGNLWFTSWLGVTKFDGKGFSRYAEAQGMKTRQILSVIQDKKGDMWFSAAAVIKFDGKHFTNYSTKNGLPLNEIPGLAQDENGNIWLGTYGKGICTFKDNQLTTYSTTQGIANNAVFKIREDTLHHRLWLATISGLSLMKSIDPSFISRDTILFENFNSKTGYGIKDFSFNFSLFIDNQGVVWGGSGDGKLIRLDYEHLEKNQTSFLLSIQNVSVNNEKICWELLKKSNVKSHLLDSLAALNEMMVTFGKDLSTQEKNLMVNKYHDLQFDSISRYYPIPQNLRLPFGKNNISFEFAAIEPAVGSQVKYQYMLEGNDKEWSPLTEKTSASFGNMREGVYTFRLKALNPYGVWSEAGYRFIVLPPWYRTWWAYLSYLAFFFMTLSLFSKWRERNLRAEKGKLELQVEERTVELKTAMEDLKSTQSQLIQSEKMASLGELSAGIAHEIQNPLNFVNNFSEVNKELLEEMKDEMNKGNFSEAKDIAEDLLINQDKIHQHGKRAGDIVKGMLQHSQSSNGIKEPTDINSLADEYLRLAWHGTIEKDNSFNVTIKTEFDETAGKISIIPQDIGRVLLNLYNNAFYALAERKKFETNGYEPIISVRTKRSGNKMEIIVKDNGAGIPEKIKEKIFQPFFTTKPTNKGTGLGLFLSYDIIKAHQGEINVVSKEGEFTEFMIQLPV